MLHACACPKLPLRHKDRRLLSQCTHWHWLNVHVSGDGNYRGGLRATVCNEPFNNRVVITSLCDSLVFPGKWQSEADEKGRGEEKRWLASIQWRSAAAASPSSCSPRTMTSMDFVASADGLTLSSSVFVLFHFLHSCCYIPTLYLYFGKAISLLLTVHLLQEGERSLTLTEVNTNQLPRNFKFFTSFQTEQKLICENVFAAVLFASQ